MPDAVAEAFAHAWDVAVAAGQVHAEALVSPERAALADVVATAEAAVAAERTRAAEFEWRLRQAETATTAQYNEMRPVLGASHLARN